MIAWEKVELIDIYPYAGINECGLIQTEINQKILNRLILFSSLIICGK